jgi:signal transduction histidine kinase
MEDTLLREKQFASDASHELRTPLSVLKGTLEIMIRKPRPSAYYIEKAATCFSEVNRMSILVDQLLLLARYESKTVMANLSKVSLEQLVHRIIARNVNSLEEKNLTINLKIGENTMVITDAFMTEQILENIFSNAVKYSYPNQAIEIFTDRSDDQVFLTVKDEGVGMEKEELSKIFDRFYRADKSRSAQSKSHGLGLAIAKRFADLLQIKISVVSQPGKGSSFTLAFPSSVGLHHS